MSTTKAACLVDRAYSNFIDSLKSPSTKETYVISLNEFTNFINQKDYEKIIKIKPMKLQESIIDFLGFMKKSGKAYQTTRVRLAAVRHFCRMNDVPINWEKIYRFLGEPIKTVEDRTYTKEEIRKMLDLCDERKRVLILTLLTGVRIGAIAPLKYKHLATTSEKYIYKLTVYAGTRQKYFCFTTPECGKAIDSYLSYRERRGEKIALESPLIREQFDREDAGSPRHIITKTLTNMIDSMLIDTGIRDGKSRDKYKRQELMRAHAFRKYVNTCMIQAGVKPVVKEMLLGHKVGLENAYYRPTEDEMLKEYLKAIDLLTISEEKKLRIQVDKLTTEVAEVETMKRAYLDIKLELEKARNERGDLYKQLYAAGVIKRDQ
jgi:integrase